MAVSSVVYTNLLEPIKIGALQLKNHVIMAPMTRARANMDHSPTDLMVKYYVQRASAGLMLTDCTLVCEHESAYIREPGIYNELQVTAWKKVTDAVHANGGLIALQLWHPGRVAHSLNSDNKSQPVGPSPIAVSGQSHTVEGKKDYEVPRELQDSELPAIVESFRLGAVNAKAAGFDAIELHAGNGYLIDEFLRDGSNKRAYGRYGGSVENRARLLLEIVTAVCTVFDAGRVGVHLTPLTRLLSMNDSDPVGVLRYTAAELSAKGIAFLDLLRLSFEESLSGNHLQDIVIATARAAFHGALLCGGGFTPCEASEAIAAKKFDAVLFGRHYIGNPDLVERIRLGVPFIEPNPATFYGSDPRKDAEGYTDYPLCRP